MESIAIRTMAQLIDWIITGSEVTHLERKFTEQGYSMSIKVNKNTPKSQGGECEAALRKEIMICPFCGESEFDAIGLKHHLLSGYCEMFTRVISVEQERIDTVKAASTDVCDCCLGDGIGADESGWAKCPSCKGTGKAASTEREIV